MRIGTVNNPRLDRIHLPVIERRGVDTVHPGGRGTGGRLERD